MAVSRIPSHILPKVNTSVAENWGYTHAEVVKFSYGWTISNFSFFCQETGEGLQSPSFSAAANDKSKWCLKLYPNGFNQGSKGFLSIYLVLVSTDKLEVTAKCTFSVLNANGVKANTHALDTASRFVQGTSIGIQKFLEKFYVLYPAYGYFSKDNLTILCEVSAVTDPVNITGQDNRIRFEVPEGKFSEDLEMEERKQNRVTITGIDHEVVEEMLQFMYADKAYNLAEMAEGLLATADKYSLEKLKVMCEVALCLKLSVETAAETLILADLHSATHLKAHAIKFIIAHPTDVMETVGWKNMIATHPHLIAEAFRAIATQ